MYKFKTITLESNQDELPKVSLMIAVRNEEQNIENLLSGLITQDYPKDKLEILIGDDASTDNTLELLQNSHLSGLHILEVTSGKNDLKGKMNVLAQLSELAKGDVLLFADADMTLDSSWVSGMVASIHGSLGMVGGLTGIKKGNFLQCLQHVELLLSQGMLKVASDLGYSFSILGNNMGVSREQYDKIGGHSNLEFSLVEDVQLMKAFLESGFKVDLQHTPDTYMETIGASSWTQLMQQRKRWILAFDQMPLWTQVVLVLKSFFIPASIISIGIQFEIIWFISLKLIFDFLLLTEVCTNSIRKPSILYFLLFELIEPIVYLSTIIYRILPIQLSWKNRKY
ncbi:MAG: glycosyltransferase [Cyclobacteriaceae bacterium]